MFLFVLVGTPAVEIEAKWAVKMIVALWFPRFEVRKPLACVALRHTGTTV